MLRGNVRMWATTERMLMQNTQQIGCRSGVGGSRSGVKYAYAGVCATPFRYKFTSSLCMPTKVTMLSANNAPLSK